MTKLVRQETIKTLVKSPTFILAGSVGALILSQLVSSLILSILPTDSYSDSINSLVSITAVGLTFAALLAVAIKLYGGGASTLGLRRPKKRWLKMTALSIVGYLIFSSLLIIAISYLFKNFDPNQAQDVGISGALSLNDKIAGFLAIVILTPIIEETLFRGIIFRGLRLSSPFWLAAFVSSGLFALAHGQWNVALDTFVLGLVLSNLAERTKSIAPGIFIHALKNSVAFILLFVISTG